jgi:Ca2+/H+ antiporter, TMEM165/GDT1 family
MTRSYALRYRWWVVLTGVAIAALMVHGLSVTIGHFLGMTLPERPIAFAAAVAFLLFAIWSWREGRGDERLPKTVPQPRFVVLATVALASDHSWAGVWIGATTGIVLADGLAIALGALLHRQLPERLLHGVASLLFALFGLWLLLDTALGWRTFAVVVTAVVAAAALAALAVSRLKASPSKARGP